MNKSFILGKQLFESSNSFPNNEMVVSTLSITYLHRFIIMINIQFQYFPIQKITMNKIKTLLQKFKRFGLITYYH